MKTAEVDFSPAVLQNIVDPWYASLKDPQKAQQDAFEYLVERYARTEYGKKYSAETISSISEFQARFPVSTYATLKPYFDDLQKGKRNYDCLFPEPVAGWVMTRGTTGNAPKVLPTNETHLSQILFAGARAIVNFALKKKMDILKKNVLNLNFPSEVFTTPTGQLFGYSSGTYAKLHPSLDAANLVPRQEEIDSLGGGVGRKDWEGRFSLAYERASLYDMGCVMGVTPVLLSFARFMKEKYDLLPKEIWNMDALFCTSVAKIHSKYAPELKHYFGRAPVVEMYTATEGVFAQQLDANPYVCPNYDLYLFEVRTNEGVKLLHELKKNEWGRLIVSSVLFPRYEIGDLIESVGKGYFRVFGRDRALTVLEHRAYNLLTGRIT